MRVAHGGTAFGGMVGASVASRAAFALLERAAPSDATVLLTGESGTGKELAALALHQLSTRAKGPFLEVNASSLPATLFESELFGARKGAYTGATHDRDCESRLRGAAYATTEVRIDAQGMTSWDRGYDAEGRQVWGATEGGYRFKRVR